MGRTQVSPPDPMIQKVRLPAVSRSFAGNAAHIYALVPVPLTAVQKMADMLGIRRTVGSSISVTFHRNRRPSNRNRLLESMCGLLVILLFPSVQIQDGQCSGKDKSACPDAEVKKDGCIIPSLDRIRNGRCFRRFFRYFRRIFGEMHGLSRIVNILVRADLRCVPSAST